MTIKEAFEALSSACAKGMKNPFFVMKRLKESFADVADKVVDAGGSTVSVTPIVESGIKIATITVDGDDSDLYAPAASVVQTITEGIEIGSVDGTKLFTPNITPLHVYDEDEHLVGRWFHNDTVEDIYEKTYLYSGTVGNSEIVLDSNLKSVNFFEPGNAVMRVNGTDIQVTCANGTGADIRVDPSKGLCYKNYSTAGGNRLLLTVRYSKVTT